MYMYVLYVCMYVWVDGYVCEVTYMCIQYHICSCMCIHMYVCDYVWVVAWMCMCVFEVTLISTTCTNLYV